MGKGKKDKKGKRAGKKDGGTGARTDADAIESVDKAEGGSSRSPLWRPSRRRRRPTPRGLL